jgi:hypothetical protein
VIIYHHHILTFKIYQGELRNEGKNQFIPLSVGVISQFGECSASYIVDLIGCSVQRVLNLVSYFMRQSLAVDIVFFLLYPGSGERRARRTDSCC